MDFFTYFMPAFFLLFLILIVAFRRGSAKQMAQVLEQGQANAKLNQEIVRHLDRIAAALETRGT